MTDLCLLKWDLQRIEVSKLCLSHENDMMAHHYYVFQNGQWKLEENLAKEKREHDIKSEFMIRQSLQELYGPNARYIFANNAK